MKVTFSIIFLIAIFTSMFVILSNEFKNRDMSEAYNNSHQMSSNIGSSEYTIYRNNENEITSSQPEKELIEKKKVEKE